MEKKYIEILDLEHTIAKELFRQVKKPWEVLCQIEDFINDFSQNLDNDYVKNGNVYIHKNAIISDKATILGPTIIGANTEVRPGAYIRGNAIIGNNCVIGNSSEVKNSIIFDGAQCPHFNYIGDSILGYKAHTGAGVILSNLKSDKTNVNVIEDNKKINTGLKKFSAIIGNNVEIGCNSVLCPGSIIFSDSIIYPLSMFRGTLDSKMIYKNQNEIVPKV